MARMGAASSWRESDDSGRVDQGTCYLAVRGLLQFSNSFARDEQSDIFISARCRPEAPPFLRWYLAGSLLRVAADERTMTSVAPA